jgi:hypothetical protein
MGMTACSRPAVRSSALAAVAVVALHASLVPALAVAVTPRSDLSPDRRSPADSPVIWLVPFGTESSRGSGLRHAVTASPAPCGDPYEVDLQGQVYEIGPPSQALLASLKSTSDEVFAPIALLCELTTAPMPPRPPRSVLSKQVPGELVGRGLGVY